MIITTIVPDGIVMAADSSLISFKMIDMENFIKGNPQEAIKNSVSGTCAFKKENIIGNMFLSKTINKLHVMKNNNIVIAEGHKMSIKNESSSPYINYFCNNNFFDDPKSCADSLLNFIKELDQNIDAIYYVCGYNPKKKIPHPEFWYLEVKNNIVLNGMGETQYGINISGANEYFFPFVSKINKNIPSYSLQDAIDVSLFAIDMSIKLERFIDREEFISPPIDLLVIEQTGVKWIQQKTLTGEY